MDADRRRKPGRLLTDGALAEGLGVELGRLGGGAVTPDSGGDELIHADIVSGAQHTGVTHASAGALQAPLAGRLDRPGGHKLTEDLVGEPLSPSRPTPCLPFQSLEEKPCTPAQSRRGSAASVPSAR